MFFWEKQWKQKSGFNNKCNLLASIIRKAVGRWKCEFLLISIFITFIIFLCSFPFSPFFSPPFVFLPPSPLKSLSFYSLYLYFWLTISLSYASDMISSYSLRNGYCQKQTPILTFMIQKKMKPLCPQICSLFMEVPAWVRGSPYGLNSFDGKWSKAVYMQEGACDIEPWDPGWVPGMALTGKDNR